MAALVESSLSSSSSSSSSSLASSPNVPPPIRLLTLNSCLFPPGLRQSYKSTHKTSRLNLIIQLMCGKLQDPFLEKKMKMKTEQANTESLAMKIAETTQTNRRHANGHTHHAKQHGSSTAEIAPISMSLSSSSSSSSLPSSSSSSTCRYDIVCLQEVFCSFYSCYYRDALLENAEIRQLFPFVASCPTIKSYRSGFLFDGGLLIFSRWPIEEKKFIPFDFNPEWMQYVQKGFLYAKIQIPLTPNPPDLPAPSPTSYFSSPSASPSFYSLHLLTTHFHPEEAAICCSRHRPSHVRKVQAAQIYNFLSSIENSNIDKDKVVLVGDINVDKESDDGEEMRRILQMKACPCDFEDIGEDMYDSFQHDSDRGKGAVCTVHQHFDFAFHAEMVCADYAMGRNVKFENVHRVRQYVSDHYPVAIDVQL